MAHFLRQSRKKPGFPLQTFGGAQRFSAAIPCAAAAQNQFPEVLFSNSGGT
jgi:hypothetical protein